MNVQVYSVPGQTEGRRRAFLEWTKKDLPSKLSITCGSNFTYYNSVHHPIPTLSVGIFEHHDNFHNKSESSPFN